MVMINELKWDGRNQECVDITSSIHHSLTNDPKHLSSYTELWSNEELMEIDTYMDLVQEYKEDGECGGSDVNML